MELTLATVEVTSDLGCSVRLFDTNQLIEAHYAQLMLNYSIRVQVGDLVAVNMAPEPHQIVFRWERAVVASVDGDNVLIDDGIQRTRSVRLNGALEQPLASGDAVYVGGDMLVDRVGAEKRPADLARFRSHHLPAIEEMYRQIGENETAPVSGLTPKQMVAQSYDQIAEAHLAWSQQVRMAERAHYTKLLLDQIPKGADVLDLGCATGALTTPQLAQRFRLTGVDISRRQIEMAQQQMPLTTFICADMTQLHFLPQSYDAVVAFYSLIHLPRHEQPPLLEKIAAWLRPNGLFVATFLAASTEGGYEDDWLGVPMFWSGYDSATNVRLVEEAGLEIVSAREETAHEFGEPVTFLWIVARKRHRI